MKKIKALVYSSHEFEKKFYADSQHSESIEFSFLDTQLNKDTAKLAQGHDLVCSFTTDNVDSDSLSTLKQCGIKLICTRSAGFNHIDIQAAKELEIPVSRVPEYSPYSVAEHAVAMLMTLNRKIHKAYNRTRENNFSLDGLIGMDLHGKTVGVIGTGKIGSVFCNIMLGFGCKLLANDKYPSKELESKGVTYTSLDELLTSSDVISLHAPLTPESQHILNKENLEKIKKNCILINTSRGGLIDTVELINALKAKKLKGACLDVYEEEEDVFFHDFSEQIVQDDVLARLMTFPNVLLTSHQAFLTEEALRNIADMTCQNINSYFFENKVQNQVIT